MLIFSRLFGRRAKADQPFCPPRQADRFDMPHGLDVQRNLDLVSGYKFVATMQLRTPLRVLRRDGETHNTLNEAPPTITTEMWEGCWVPQMRTFREIGIDIDEVPNPTRASDVGPIPQNGGTYLTFLIAVRTAAESDGTVDERRAAAATVLGDPKWKEWADALNGRTTALDRLFPPFLSTIPRLSVKASEELAAAGYASPNAINAASDSQLRNVDGIGPGLLAALRAAIVDARNPESRFIDNVVR